MDAASASSGKAFARRATITGTPQMAISDRDYMQESSEDEQRIKSYEEAARTNEYDDLAWHRRRSLQKPACVIVAVLVLLVLLGAVAQFLR